MIERNRRIVRRQQTLLVSAFSGRTSFRIPIPLGTKSHIHAGRTGEPVVLKILVEFMVLSQSPRLIGSTPIAAHPVYSRCDKLAHRKKGV